MTGKKPTREQRRFLEDHGLNTYNWLIQKDCSEFMQVVHKTTKKEKIIKK